MIAAIAAPALLLGAVACSDDNAADSGSSASARSVDEINARIQRNEMITALLGIGALPLHEIEEELAGGGEIPNDAVPSMRTLIRLASLTNWHPDLQAGADKLHEAAERFIEAAETGNRGGATGQAINVHNGWHDFSEEAWDLVAPGAGGEHADNDDEAPEATP
jgi:hypothetical protein